MNETITVDATSGAARRTGNWVTRGAAATGKGVACFGFTLAALGLWTALLIAVALTPLGVGFPLVAATLRGMRRLAAGVRRSLGIAVQEPYLPGPAAGRRSFWARFGSLITDPGTWRDLLWSVVDMLVGWLFTMAPIGLVLYGVFGVIMPAIWHPIVAAKGNNWYAFIHVTSASTAWLSAALGPAFIALGLLTASWFLRRYAALARSLQTSA